MTGGPGMPAKPLKSPDRLPNKRVERVLEKRPSGTPRPTTSTTARTTAAKQRRTVFAGRTVKASTPNGVVTIAARASRRIDRQSQISSAPRNPFTLIINCKISTIGTATTGGQIKLSRGTAVNEKP